MAPQLPWIYQYEIDETAARDGREVLRPIVSVRVGASDLVQRGLVDTGSDHILIAPFLGRELGLRPVDADDGFVIGVGGGHQRVRPETVQLELLPPNGEPPGICWEAPVHVVSQWQPDFAVLLGARGFMDRFTVTFHRGVQAFAVDQDDRFERVYESVLADGDERIRPWTRT